MRKLYACLVLAACLLLSAGNTLRADDSGAIYIKATSVNLRDKPVPTSKVIAVLSIATAIKVVSYQKGADYQSSWQKVVVINGPHVNKIGWVSAAFTDPHQPTVDLLMAYHDSEQPCDLESRKTWIDRAKAIDPVKAEAAIQRRRQWSPEKQTGTQTVPIETGDGGCCRTEATFDASKLSFEKLCDLLRSYYRQSRKHYIDHGEWNRLHGKYGVTLRHSCTSGC